MSFIETARAFALEAAASFENKARSIGIMRSVDATEASQWLKDVAQNLRSACDPGDPAASAEQLDQVELRDAAAAALAWLENTSRTTSREQLSRRLRRALGMPSGWKAQATPKEETGRT